MKGCKMFHQRLRQLKDESAKTQKQIATELQISEQALSYYFNGREPDYDLLVKIADLFNVTIDYLLGRTNENLSIESIEITLASRTQKLIAMSERIKKLEALLNQIKEV